MLLIIIATLCFAVLYWWTRTTRPQAISVAVERHVVNVMANIDDEGLASDEEEGKVFFDPTMKKSRFQAKIVAIAKVEFGLLPRTTANRLMVRKFMRDYMREKLMRPTHIIQHLDVSVACFFIPSDQDITAHQFGATREALNREGMMTSLWESAYGHLGAMLGFSKS